MTLNTEPKIMGVKQNEEHLKCLYGMTVKLQNTRTMVITTYALVTAQEEKLDKKHISNYTDIGKAIWGKEAGQVVEVSLPSKEKDIYKILSVSFT